MSTITKKRINNNRAFVCVKENDQLVAKPADVFGCVRAIVGHEVPPDQIAQLVYDLYQQQHSSCIKVELCTGGG